jgi:hypothetical protein
MIIVFQGWPDLRSGQRPRSGQKKAFWIKGVPYLPYLPYLFQIRRKKKK